MPKKKSQIKGCPIKYILMRRSKSSTVQVLAKTNTVRGFLHKLAPLGDVLTKTSTVGTNSTSGASLRKNS